MPYDVVVVGAGPTGLMLACELQLAGSRTLVIERLERPADFSKALGVHARTVELLDLRGLCADFLQDARKLPGGNFASLGVPLELTPFDTEHPYVLFVPQVRTEELLTRRALELGVELRRGHTLTALEQDDQSVTATVTGPDGPTQITSSYLVGCDGGGSTVRKLLGIDFPGEKPHMLALIADARFREELPRGEGMGPMRPRGVMRHDLRAWFSAFPLEGGVFRITVAFFDRPFADRRAPITDEDLRVALREVAGDDFGMYDVRWRSRLTDASRQATRYREGRVLLAGDSCHIHLPAGGQGLNLGFQDAVNLGWKLGATVTGTASPHLLETYEAERRPVADGVLRNTRAQAVLIDPDPRFRGLQDLMRDLLRQPETNRYLAGLVSALDVRYPIDGEHPLVGRRMPDLLLDADTGRRRLSTHFHAAHGVLLTLSPDPHHAELATPWKDRVDLVTATDVLERGPAVEGLSAVLIRPDGYVCWAGSAADDTEGLTSALRTWFGSPLS
ncbi:FAD-dependent monooxygenase [Streptomyces halobius]|uniref:FAD-dependent monooxygenase n=1 Tax=Streptomyces halobius TaxID=2879846 RepID=A0ABY4M708_9ACTN|nr:FAD-dependent monooxygenase [Streptomyces halobius]UQA92609.1 FAD-dependent monooxygenase [Streptomyces halobius]